MGFKMHCRRMKPKPLDKQMAFYYDNYHNRVSYVHRRIKKDEMVYQSLEELCGLQWTSFSNRILDVFSFQHYFFLFVGGSCGNPEFCY